MFGRQYLQNVNQVDYAIQPDDNSFRVVIVIRDVRTEDEAKTLTRRLKDALAEMLDAGKSRGLGCMFKSCPGSWEQDDDFRARWKCSKCGHSFRL